MPKTAIFHGSMTALVTPFNHGVVDFEALRRMVDWQIESGTHGLVPVGTTGESPTLSHEEHGEVISATILASEVTISPTSMTSDSPLAEPYSP